MAVKIPVMGKLARIEARTEAFNSLRRMLFVVFCAASGFTCVAMAFPHRQRLDEMEQSLKEAKVREQLALADRDNMLTEHKALREDPEFLEVHARDRWGLYREGEKVLKFRK
jgi:cell division protein FtsB